MVKSCCGILSLEAGVRVIGGLNIAVGLLGALAPAALPFIRPYIVCSTSPDSLASVEIWYGDPVESAFTTSEYVLRGLCIGFGFLAIVNTIDRLRVSWVLPSFIGFLIAYALTRVTWNLYLVFSPIGYSAVLAFWGNPGTDKAVSVASICINTNQRVGLTYSSLLLLTYLYSVRVVSSYIKSCPPPNYLFPAPDLLGRPLSAGAAAALDVERLRQAGILSDGVPVT